MSKFKFLNGFKDKLNKIFRRNKKIDIDLRHKKLGLGGQATAEKYRPISPEL